MRKHHAMMNIALWPWEYHGKPSLNIVGCCKKFNLKPCFISAQKSCTILWTGSMFLQVVEKKQTLISVSTGDGLGKHHTDGLHMCEGTTDVEIYVER